VSTLTKKYYICDLHFRRTDFTRVVTPYKDKLKKTALPKAFEGKEYIPMYV